MKLLHHGTVAVLVPCLLLQSCASLGDDAFAHGVKSGNSRAVVSTIRPGQARLHIYERDGRWYYPIHYTIARGDAASTFALIRNGSPTRLDGRSLAYNAARVRQTRLAKELASSGFGKQQDISEALADNHRERKRNGDANAMALLGIVALLAVMGSSSSSSDESSSGMTAGEEQDAYMREQNRNAANNGQPIPYGSTGL
ncbi:MAG: hypothetical protein ABIS50_03865 [Luteolibacter sp.]|uniref:hypothetical protein n=1 Tax=Luteolibacter sp. TaxID=1962973 RepID=UPI003267DB45